MDTHPKRARPDVPVHELIAARWSPYAFDGRLVSGGDLASLFEAARWAASSYNEQPWRYILATRDDVEGFQRMLSCLVEGNREWARNAAAVALGVVSLRFARNDKPNRAAHHDLGLASAGLTLEATARGLHVHQMVGILPDRAREVYGIPEGFEPLTALAVGYAADPDSVPGPLGDRDRTERARRPVAEFVFAAGWERPAF
ncbi:MAG: nitroreductase family protein [Gemmatimonadota bacterium]